MTGDRERKVMLRKTVLLALVVVVAAGFIAYGCGNVENEDAGVQVEGGEMAVEGSPGVVRSTDPAPEGTARLVLGGGCFWCIEAVFETVDGVNEVVSGYSGGTTTDPDYDAVCSGDTGHAEVVLIDYDPSIVSMEGLLELFFATHDPTTEDRQGYDVGTQYRSIIFYESEEQKAAIEDFIEKAASDFDDPIVTEVEQFDAFYPAEEYHQDYYSQNPNAPYCSSIISPKVKKAKEKLGSE